MNTDSEQQQAGDFLVESFHFKEITWNIHIFSLPKCLGFKLESPPFSLADATWELQMYPNGFDYDTQDYIGLAVEKLNTQTLDMEHFAFCKFEIKTRNGKRIFSQYNNQWFAENGDWWFSPYYMQKSKLYGMRNIIAPHGILTVVFQIRIKKTELASSTLNIGSIQPPLASSSNKALQDFKDLFLKQDQCDIIIKVKGQKFLAHRSILIARSSVFASNFSYNMKEKSTGVLNIEDCDPSSFSDFLCFLYCGKVENLSEKNVFNLFTVADKYNVQDLRSECLEFIKRINLSVDNFCDIVSLTLLYPEKELVKSTTDFFAKNFQEIIVTSKWQKLVTEHPVQSNEIMIKALVSKKK